jgi:hypothetical protein
MFYLNVFGAEIIIEAKIRQEKRELMLEQLISLVNAI